MKEFLLCVTAFSLTTIIDSAPVQNAGRLSDFRKWTLMECDSTDKDGGTIQVVIDEISYKAIGECIFGGYYPVGPRLSL
jgi:hypothetical protein